MGGRTIRRRSVMPLHGWGAAFVLSPHAPRPRVGAEEGPDGVGGVDLLGRGAEGGHLDSASRPRVPTTLDDVEGHVGAALAPTPRALRDAWRVMRLGGCGAAIVVRPMLHRVGGGRDLGTAAAANRPSPKGDDRVGGA